MALDFPPSPTLNQQYTSGGKTWQWDGTVWQNLVPIGNTGYTGSIGYTGSGITTVQAILWNQAF